MTYFELYVFVKLNVPILAKHSSSCDSYDFFKFKYSLKNKKYTLLLLCSALLF